MAAVEELARLEQKRAMMIYQNPARATAERQRLRGYWRFMPHSDHPSLSSA